MKLSRPSVTELEPARWQVIDATHIRAVFDLHNAPHGLYDISVTNPDGQRVTEAYRYLIDRGIEADVTIGIGGARNLEPGDRATYSVSLQSLTNVDTPYVRFEVGATEMGSNEYLLESQHLPFVIFGTNIAGQPDGKTVEGNGTTQSYGSTPTDGTPRKDISWAQLDGAVNTTGYNLAPGYAFDVAAGGFVGMAFNLQTYPGLTEWINHDFEGLRDKLYAIRPDWKASGILDGGVGGLNSIVAGLTAKFLHVDTPEEPDVHITKLERLAMPFRFNVLGAATPLTRDEFMAEQVTYAKKLRAAILADASAPASLSVLAADEAQWAQGWLGALEAAGLLRPVGEAPPIRKDPKVVSLNATLATGILLSKGGDSYRSQADLLGFFNKVQQWYGDTASYSGDAAATKSVIDYLEVRKTEDGQIDSPVPKLADPAAYDQHAAQDTHFLNFNVFVGGRSEMEYLRHIGVLGQDFQPVGAQALNLTQYLQQAAAQTAAANAAVSVKGPQAVLGSTGNAYLPADTALPYSIAFNNTSNTALGQLRIVTDIDADLDIRSLRLGDLKLGDINVHVPTDKANFQGDFDFSGSKGFVLRVSAGIDVQTRIATWLIQAIDPDTGEVLHDALRGLLTPSAVGTTQDPAAKRGFVSYTIRSSAEALSNAEITAQARIFIDNTPPVDSERVTQKLDAKPPTTDLAVTSLGLNAQGASNYSLKWIAIDDASGIKGTTLYVAQNSGDFKIWLRQAPATQSEAVFTGDAGSTYEFLAVSTDNAGNREAASVANAVLPDDGSRQAVLDALGVNETVSQTAELPLATPDRSYAANGLFTQAALRLPGYVATAQPSDLKSVLAPFSVRGLAEGFAKSDADIGALAMVELADQSILVSAGAQRNEVFRFSKDGGRSTTPLFSLSEPILDMALDAVGQLWVLTGKELLLVDATSGSILRRLVGPSGNSLTHALAIQSSTGDIYVSSGQGVEIFRPNEANAARAWTHFSNERVSDLAFGPDGRLWAVRWSGRDITAAKLNGTTDIISFPMTGKTKGRAELEYRLNAVIDSISFGAAGTQVAGLMFASSDLKQHPTTANAANDTVHQSTVWMVELQSRRVLQLATGGTRGETILATADGRILVAESNRVDEIAPIKAPNVTAISVPDGALLPLPVSQISVSFDKAMWTGAGGLDTTDAASVVNPDNFVFTSLAANTTQVIKPRVVTWNAAARTTVLDIAGLPAGQWQLEVSGNLRSAAQISLTHSTISTFTAVLDMTNQVRLDFTNTRGNRATGEVSYDVSITNIGTDDLRGPLMLLLDPGRYFGDAVVGASQGSGNQSDLWVLDLTSTIQATGGKFAVGQTLSNQTITVRPASSFGTTPGSATLVKFNLSHGVYAAPLANVPPILSLPGTAVDFAAEGDTIATAPLALPPATAGLAWTALIQANDADGIQFFWQIVQAPAGLTLHTSSVNSSDAVGYHNLATLIWTPTTKDLQDSEVILRVQDSRGGVATRRFSINVIGGNQLPSIDTITDVTLTEGETLSLPLTAADADGDTVTLTVKNLPSGASFDASKGILTWSPSYDQAGQYNNITVLASDGKSTVTRSFNVTVAQGYAQPVLVIVPAQTLREGEAFGMQLAGNMPGGLVQADGTNIVLAYSAPWLPGGATLNSETGFISWTPGYAQHGDFTVPVTLTATYTKPDSSEPVTTSTTRNVVLNVLNANGAPQFDAAETWNILEGQPLRISVFAFDPDNPSFEPKVRLNPNGAASGPETTAPTVSYQVIGLPAGASFDAETLELVWTPGYDQAGSYSVRVIATDTGDGTGAPAVSELTLPIIVSNTNRAPIIGSVINATLYKGATLDIPVYATDVDGNPVTLTLSGLPSFATYTQTSAAGASAATGTIHFAPGEASRGDYTITVVAQDNGDGNINQVLVQAKSFVVSVRADSEPPVISAPLQVVAVVGQPMVIPVSVRDLDQDALSYSILSGPVNAIFSADVPDYYGHATVTWTPTAADIGVSEITLQVTDSGKGPQDAGFIVDPNAVLAPNVRTHTIRIVVRNAVDNTAPTLLGITATGGTSTDTTVAAVTTTQVTATEGVPLAIDLFAKDLELDGLSWTVTNLPAGMVLDVNAANNANRATLRWTPGYFATQTPQTIGTVTGVPGQYRVTVSATDGAASFTRELLITVANVNQTPRILPLPLQLVSEGETLSFSVRGVDADNDATRLALVYDDSTPAGLLFDAASGYLEWTPSQDIANNASALSTPFNLTFSVTDGTATSQQTVQVRVFDVNRAPMLNVSSHAAVVGTTLMLPISLVKPTAGSSLGTVNTSAAGIQAWDEDGSAQTAGLTVSFYNLPEGATYNAQSKQLVWTPGPGQVGDFVVTARVSDGFNTTSKTFTLRVVAEAAANAPKVLINTTPSTPALPGQTVVATIRAQGYSPIQSLAVEVRGLGTDTAQWQSVTLDGAGRISIKPTQPGLIDIRVTATDQDGFSATQVQTVRVKDPLDASAPAIAWAGSLAGNTAVQAPVSISNLTSVQASLQELQLMGYQLQIAPADTSSWTTLAQQSTLATTVNRAALDALAIGNVDPTQFANGVYQLRFTAWDLAGRTSEINTRILIDSATKQPSQATATDGVYSLGGHSFALLRVLDNPVGDQKSSLGNDFGNWRIPALETGLTHDQDSATALGATAPWQEGAKVWLTAPDLSTAIDSIAAHDGSTGATGQYVPQALRFTLSTVPERALAGGTASNSNPSGGATPVGVASAAPIIYRPVFTSSQAGWSLTAHTDANQGPQGFAPEALQRQGSRLYTQSGVNAGLPWVPESYTLTGPDGARYQLDAQGQLTSVQFADGVQWLVSDAGIALVEQGNALPTHQRLDFLRDDEGRLTRVSTKSLDAAAKNATLVESAIAYKYDAAGRMVLSRTINSTGTGTPYGYDNAGSVLPDAITANLGAATSWISAPAANVWTGSLQAGQTTSIAFAVRESEITSTVKTPGAQGAVIIALQTELADPLATVEVTGATVLGTTTVNGKRTILLRVTEAGLKLIRIQGTGTARLSISIAGDINEDGKVNGLDSQAWAQGAAANAAGVDVNGDGQATAADRQVLYANYGFKANQAPVQINTAALSTHTDLAANVSLANVAQDLEGDSIFWRILSNTHGTAKLSADGQTLLFTPEMGYAGQAIITVRADDGFAAAAPIALTVNVSGAKLIAIRLADLAATSTIEAGRSLQPAATLDFADAQGVVLNAEQTRGYLRLESLNLASMGGAKLNGIGGSTGSALTVNAQGGVRLASQGGAILRVSRINTDGSVIQTVQALNIAAAPLAVTYFDPNAAQADAGDGEEVETLAIQPDVYPGTLSLTPGGTRQLKVHVVNPSTGDNLDIHSANQIAFAAQPETTEQYTDPDTGEVSSFVYPAVAEVLSGTRYFVSDSAIATVDQNGLITALQSGQVTIAIVHLASITDAYGNISQQIAGQSVIRLTVQTAQLTDTDAATPAPSNITVAAATGGVVAAATGETVLIGAGVLGQDSAIGISRLDLSTLEATTGLAAPAPSVLQGIGSFKLELGASQTAYPVQLSIPLQAGLNAQDNTQVGDEVLFFRRGTVPVPGGTEPTWWLVDNGFISRDAGGNLVAKTASPPYGGVDSSGEYFVCRKIDGVIGGTMDFVVATGSWLSFGGFSLGACNLSSNILGILATMAGPMGGGSYHFGIPQFADIPLAARQTNKLDVGDFIPPTPSPYGQVAAPNIAGADFDAASGTLTLYRSGASPTDFPSELVIRAFFADGTSKDLKTLPGSSNLPIKITAADLAAAGLSNVALGSLRFQAVRTIDTRTITSSGNLNESKPMEIAGNTVSLTPAPDMAAVLTRNGVQFVRQNKVEGEVALLDAIGSNNFGGQYISGTKLQSVAFSSDLSRAYVAGRGVIYAIDLISFKLIDTIRAPAAKNIMSLATAGDYLLIGEGYGYGTTGPGGYRLLAMNTNPASASYHNADKIISLKGTGIEATTYGVGGMALGPDGRTLVVTLPNAPNRYGYGTRGPGGDVIVLDLESLNLTTGKIDPPVKATTGGDTTVKFPQTVTATWDKDRFLVASPNDVNRGLGALTLKRDDVGKVTSAALVSIEMPQPFNAVRIDRLNIQRAQSAVLVEQGGIEYAIVSDDNHPFEDGFVQAMFEAPMFVSLGGPPIPFGGSASAKKVAAGGKLGIVQDPFGKLGAPKYLGATLPLDGYGIINLSLSEDGDVLIGQLIGGFSVNFDDFQQKPHQNHAWSVPELINAALANPQPLSKHIKLAAGAEQLIPIATSTADYTAAPAGTAFDPKQVMVKAIGNMGDVIKVDLRDLAARKMLDIDLFKLESALTNVERSDLGEYKANLKGFYLDLGVLEEFGLTTARSGTTEIDYKPTPQLMIATQTIKSVLRPLGEDSAIDDFATTGVLYLIPNLSLFGDMKKLRSGDVVSAAAKSLGFGYGFYDGNPGIAKTELARHGFAGVAARDYATTATTFFGDRPLDNPGYSKMTLKGQVGVGSTNKLDVLKVEQRLKYLGFPAMKTGTGNIIKDFTVDGTFSVEDKAALKLFEKVVRYESSGVNARYANDANGADGALGTVSRANQQIALPTKAQLDDNADFKTWYWLNAYNAPHWMQYFGSTGSTGSTGSAGTAPFAANNGNLSGWSNSQLGTRAGDVEVFGTSWMRDLMVAKQFAPTQLVQNDSLFNGVTDANHVFTPLPTSHSSHDLGMAMDLGISNHIDFANQTRAAESRVTAIVIPQGAPQWSSQRAVDLSNLLNAQPFIAPGGERLINNQRAAVQSFLSMYWATKEDIKQRDAQGNQTQQWVIQNGQNEAQKREIQSLLFRATGNDGRPNADKSVITETLIGANLTKSAEKGGVSANRYPEVGKVLTALGIKNGLSNGHQNHFHIYTTPPAPKGLSNGPNNLLAEFPPNASYSLGLDVASKDFYIDQSDLNQAVEMLAQAQLPRADRIVKICKQWLDTGNRMTPASDAIDVYNRWKTRSPEQMPKHLRDLHALSVTMVQKPSFGTLKVEGNNTNGRNGYDYSPRAGFEGADQISFLVKLSNGKSVLMLYQMEYGYTGDTQKCYLKFGERLSAIDPLQLLDANSDYVAWQRSANLSALIASAQQTLAGFTDLPGTALGQTTGEGLSAQITLDTNAAGHNWYIDPTPLDNSDDYLPTSDPTVWKAKAGSAAAGKMDLLSVLLHEYGHALGLEHSGAASDFMAASLQPGVRKLPSAAELTLMSQLVAELKGAAGDALTPTLSQGETEQDPSNPFAPSPLSALGLLPFGLMRRNDGRGSSNAALTAGAATQTDYLTAINTTLANGSFSAGQNGSVDQWESIGNVTAAPAIAFQAVTLGESTTAQAHLGQAFVLSAQDRFLTFTVSGLNLQTNSIEQTGVFTAAPQDAFEVALQNANTGANLLATGTDNLGTSHSDALLNVQLASSSAGAALQERAVSGLRHTDHADGSRTYVLDLSGIAAGTAVNLSFDLIGFGLTTGQLGSKVTISDVRLISAPLAVADTASLIEDGSTTLTVQANDLHATALGFAPRLVASAQHGQVSVDAAGRIVYTPDANFFGTDSFTYQYSNGAGTELSNLATVTLTVTPVNDAPVAADVTVSTIEDNEVTINVVAFDADNTSAELVFSIQTQPAHGSLVQNADGSYSYTPAANFNGADSFTYTVTDGDLVSNLATVRIHVTAVNDAPTLGNQALTVAEDSVASGCAHHQRHGQ